MTDKTVRRLAGKKEDETCPCCKRANLIKEDREIEPMRRVNTLTIFRNHPVFSKLPKASIEQLGTYLTKRKIQRGTDLQEG